MYDRDGRADGSAGRQAPTRTGVIRRLVDWLTGKAAARRKWEREWADTVRGQLDAVEAGMREDGRNEPRLLMAKAVRCLRERDARSAFAALAEAKKLRRPTRGLDQLRAVCFIVLERIGEARESLLEELRFFPDNAGATALLEQIAGKRPAGVSGTVGDRDFQDLLAEIRPFTMLSEERLHSLYTLARRVCEQDLPGSFVECGVAGGGSSALLAAVIKRHSCRPRVLFAFDTFEGMPAPTADDTHDDRQADDTGWGTGTCAAPESSVREACSRLGAAEVVEAVKGYFKDTLPVARERIGPIALLHMDADWYESTRDILRNLYDQLREGGVVQVDDYGHWEGCAKALREFEEERGVRFEMHRIDYSGVWFAKPAAVRMPGGEGVR